MVTEPPSRGEGVEMDREGWEHGSGNGGWHVGSDLMLPAWALAVKVTGLRGAGVGSGEKERNQGFRCRDATGSTWMSVGQSDTEVCGLCKR